MVKKRLRHDFVFMLAAALLFVPSVSHGYDPRQDVQDDVHPSTQNLQQAEALLMQKSKAETAPVVSGQDGSTPLERITIGGDVRDEQAEREAFSARPGAHEGDPEASMDTGEVGIPTGSIVDGITDLVDSVKDLQEIPDAFSSDDIGDADFATSDTGVGNDVGMESYAVGSSAGESMEELPEGDEGMSMGSDESTSPQVSVGRPESPHEFITPDEEEKNSIPKYTVGLPRSGPEGSEGLGKVDDSQQPAYRVAPPKQGSGGSTRSGKFDFTRLPGGKTYNGGSSQESGKKKSGIFDYTRGDPNDNTVYSEQADADRIVRYGDHFKVPYGSRQETFDLKLKGNHYLRNKSSRYGSTRVRDAKKITVEVTLKAVPNASQRFPNGFNFEASPIEISVFYGDHTGLFNRKAFKKFGRNGGLTAVIDKPSPGQADVTVRVRRTGTAVYLDHVEVSTRVTLETGEWRGRRTLAN